MNIKTTSNEENLALFKKVPFFTYLADAEAMTFLRAKTKLVTYQANAILFDEGAPGDYMYIVISGAVDLFLRDTQSGERRLTISISTVKKGGHFGEQSLLPGSSGKRGASAKTIVTSTLLQIHKKDFVAILKPPEQEQNKEKKPVELDPERDFEVIDMLRTSRLFQCMEMDETIHYQKWSEAVALSASEILFEKGSPSDCLYLIINGIIGIYFAGSDGLIHNLAKYSTGQYFGEQSIMPNAQAEKRNAAARAETDALLLRISKLQFHKILRRDQKLKQALDIIGQKQAHLRKLRTKSM